MSALTETTTTATKSARQASIMSTSLAGQASSATASSSQPPAGSSAPAPTESQPPTSDLSELLLVCKVVLMQGVDLLDQHLTEDAQLVRDSKFLPGSTIGKHLRHARDHFVLLLNSVTGNKDASPQAPYQFSYDVRLRNTPMETSRAAAREALLETVQQLEAVVPGVGADAAMQLDAITPYMQSFKTSFGRELWFGALHAVHHWSMVRVIAGEMGVQMPSDFGFAPSTLVYQNREAPLGTSKGKM